MYIKLLYNSRNSNFFLLYRKETGIRVYLYINKRININTWEEISLFKDVCAITLRPKGRDKDAGEESIQILNVYNLSLSLVINDNPFSLLVLKEGI